MRVAICDKIDPDIQSIIELALNKGGLTWQQVSPVAQARLQLEVLDKLRPLANVINTAYISLLIALHHSKAGNQAARMELQWTMVQMRTAIASLTGEPEQKVQDDAEAEATKAVIKASASKGSVMIGTTVFTDDKALVSLSIEASAAGLQVGQQPMDNFSANMKGFRFRSNRNNTQVHRREGDVTHWTVKSECGNAVLEIYNT